MNLPSNIGLGILTAQFRHLSDVFTLLHPGNITKEKQRIS